MNNITSQTNSYPAKTGISYLINSGIGIAIHVTVESKTNAHIIVSKLRINNRIHDYYVTYIGLCENYHQFSPSMTYCFLLEPLDIEHFNGILNVDSNATFEFQIIDAHCKTHYSDGVPLSEIVSSFNKHYEHDAFDSIGNY